MSLRVGPFAVALFGLAVAGRPRPSVVAPERHGPAPPAPSIAITIDDLPWNGDRGAVDSAGASTDRMIAVLRAHHAPVAVFVNCGRLSAPDSLLRRWAMAGAEIGNHTWGHEDLNSTPPATWAERVSRCDADLRRRLGHPVRFFRFPALHEGRTDAEYDAAAATLRRLGYRVAHVTVDDDDFLLAAPYRRAMERRDTSARRTLAAALVEHDLAAVTHYQAVARSKVARDVSHILLLHANRITADALGALLDSLAARGARFITLDAALADPVFARRDEYRGPRGLSFLYRIAPIASDADAWDRAEADRLTRLIRSIAR